jgi:hypothetical protein
MMHALPPKPYPQGDDVASQRDCPALLGDELAAQGGELPSTRQADAGFSNTTPTLSEHSLPA